MNKSRRDLDLVRERGRKRRHLLLMLLLVPLVAAVVGAALTIINGKNLVITPSDAAATANLQKIAGVGWIIGETVYRLTGPVDVEVNAPGFFAERVQINSEQPGTYIAVQMREIPARVVAYSEPGLDETTWLLDGQMVGSGPVYETELAPGTYQLVADNGYYELSSQQLELSRDQDYALEFKLEPVQGVATIRSVPADAAIIIDGRPVGNSNLDVPLTGGRYSIEVAKARHATVRDQIEVTRARPEPRRSYQLSASPAYVTVAVSPAGGKLLLNGAPIQAGARIDVSPGTRHVIAYDLAGFHTRTEEVTLKPGESRRVNLALEANQGSVVIESTPPAQVEVNGRLAGDTPLTLDLPSVEHNISIIKPGYITHSEKVLPTSSREMKINVMLSSEKDHRQRTAPPRYQNKVGMQMVLFRPETYRKGSAPGAPHRRANEAEHTVHLRRPFYSAAHEVSLGQFQASGLPIGTGQPGYPVTNVTWELAARYCNWLSTQENLQPVYQFRQGRYTGADMGADGYRLLTESEWEWLARKAGRLKQAVYEWGNDDIVPSQAGNFADEQAKAEVNPNPYIPRYDDGFARLAPIGSFPPGPSGLFDLSGNASEWVHDAYKLIPNAEAESVDPAGPGFGERHVVKGSSWRTAEPDQMRPAYRDTAATGRDDLGFRVARYLYKES